MISRLVALSVRHQAAVLTMAALSAAAGLAAYRRLSRDAVPELADPRIVLRAEWMGHPAPEVAGAVTGVLTAALDGVPGASAVRGTSMTGMAFVEVVFRSASDLGAGRAAIDERVHEARAHLPSGATVLVGPLASSTGWIFEYALVDPRLAHPLSDLRRLQDEVLRPALASVPGVAEVATVGAGGAELLVEARPSDLAARRTAFFDLVAPLQAVAGRADSVGPKDIEDLSVNPGGPRVRDVAQVRVAPDMPIGVVDYDGVGAAVGGIVVARADADLGRLVAGVKAALDRQRERLPRGVELVTVYDRSELSARVEHTLLRALGEEVTVVMAVVLVFLLSPRSLLVPLLTLPLVLLLTFAGMWLCGITATVMSLGGIGIALGMAVDADLVALEACARRLEPGGDEAGDRRGRLVSAAASFAPAILTSLLIAALAFLPVLVFTGETGRLLRPLAITKTLLVVSAALVALIVAPVLRDRLLGDRAPPELANPITRTLVRLYRPFVHFALERPRLTLLTAGLALVSCLPLLPRLGGEFFPRLDEGDLLFMPTTLPGVMPEEAREQLARQDRILKGFPEVATVFGKSGRADTATDPAPLSMIETVIRLKPKWQWPRRPRPRWYSGVAPAALQPILRLVWPDSAQATTSELIDNLDRATRLPGWTSAWTSPARARMDMMSTGVRTPVGVRIVSSDLSRLGVLGEAVRGVVERLPGTRSAALESLGGETWPDFVATPEVLAALGADAAEIGRAASFVISRGDLGPVRAAGSTTGTAERPQRLRLALDAPAGRLADRISQATVRVPAGAAGQPAPLGLLGRVAFVNRPALVRSERGESVAYVYVDLDAGVDLSRYVERAKSAVQAEVTAGALDLRPGERIEWTGQYELLAAGRRRLVLIVPLVVVSMLGLLFLQFRSLAEALIVLSSVPFALVGSVWTLFVLGFPLSAPVWVGLLSVVGLAMQTGVVMVVYVDESFHRHVREGLIRDRGDIVAAHAEGSVRRLRPKLMTVTTMAAGLLPLLWANGAGAEVMRRVAAPMLGGLLTSAFLTLEVLPVLCTIWRSSQLRRSRRTGRPLAEVVGPAPPWARTG